MKEATSTATATTSILIDGHSVACEIGSTVASVLLANGYYVFSEHPVDQSPRAPFCMMGACQACRLIIDGRWQQSCQVVVCQGLCVTTGLSAIQSEPLVDTDDK